MRLLKVLLLLLIVLVVVVGVVLWTLPAGLAYRHVGSRLGPVTLSGIRGTIWDGHADGVSAFGRDLGELDWQLDKSSLLHRALKADVRLKGADVDAAGTVVRASGDVFEVRDLRFRVPAALLEPAIDVPDLKLRGTVSGVLAHARLEGGLVRQARGSARWSDAAVAGAAEARFSDVLADFASQPDGSIAGTVHDDGKGDLAVEGVFSVRYDGYDAEATLGARHGNARIAEMLQYVGQPQADGSSRLVIHGTLFKLF
jgi:hypothetical protein